MMNSDRNDERNASQQAMSKEKKVRKQKNNLLSDMQKILVLAIQPGLYFFVSINF